MRTTSWVVAAQTRPTVGVQRERLLRLYTLRMPENLCRLCSGRTQTRAVGGRRKRAHAVGGQAVERDVVLQHALRHAQQPAAAHPDPDVAVHVLEERPRRRRRFCFVPEALDRRPGAAGRLADPEQPAGPGGDPQRSVAIVEQAPSRRRQPDVGRHVGALAARTFRRSGAGRSPRPRRLPSSPRLRGYVRAAVHQFEGRWSRAEHARRRRPTQSAPR